MELLRDQQDIKSEEIEDEQEETTP